MSEVTKGGKGVFEKANYYMVPKGEHVYSWSPDPEPGRSPATQVHLHFGDPPGDVFVVRFKSPRTLSILIHALREHRDDVWPNICDACDGSGLAELLVPHPGEKAQRISNPCRTCGGKGLLK